MKLSRSQRRERRNRARMKREISEVLIGKRVAEKRHIRKLATILNNKLMELSSEKIVSDVTESSPNSQ